MNRGLERGHKEGFASGQKEGFSNGRREGKKETAIEIAEKMLREGLPTDLIVRVSGLSLSEIEKIKEQMEAENIQLNFKNTTKYSQHIHRKQFKNQNIHLSSRGSCPAWAPSFFFRL